ncbi:MAG: hypothetical protein A2X84_09110 [Desulfuromonadaceae bacterium GWC2_58_13]|nr:MAG: hypothetical protein A2X84_09110 [Desulfuromonadaceae bacterium GWC2_58_13]
MTANLIQKAYRFLVNYPKAIVSVLGILTVLGGVGYSRLPIETSVESLIIENDPDLLFYEKFKSQFGEDEFLVVAFAGPEIFSASTLAWIAEKNEELEGIKEVREVVSLTTVEDIVGSDYDFIIRPLVEKIPETPEGFLHIRQRALDNPLIRGSLISNDGRASLFLIRTVPHPGDETYDARLIEQVTSHFQQDVEMPSGLEWHLAGWLVTDVNMAGYMNRDMVIFMPITYLLLIVLLWFFLRNGYAVCISVLNISLCLIWTMAFLYLVGGAMSPMTSILSPLMMALALSDSVHIFSDFLKQERSAGNVVETMGKTLERLTVPCFLTSLTTAIGFASLAVSDIPPIRHFGLAAACGMMAEFVLSITVLPLGIWFLRRRPGLLKKRAGSYAGGYFGGAVLKRLVSRYPLYVLVVSAVLVVLAIVGITRLQVETNLIEYFKKDSTVYQDTHFVDEHLGGVNTLEVSFLSSEPDAFKDPVNLQILEEVAVYLESQPDISRSTTVADFLKQMNRAFHGERKEAYTLPDSREMVAQYLLLYDGDELVNFIDSDYRWARLSAQISEHSSSVLKRRIEDLQIFLRNRFAGSGLEIVVTGKTSLVNKLVQNIVDSQVQSLALACGVIFAILLGVFRSLSLGLLSLVPNILPIVFNLGLMGWLGIPLNTATAIISAVAIGIAVDDTIHFIHQYQEDRRSGMGRHPAVLAALEKKGGAIVTTSLILMGGFGVLVLSSFVPTIQFGFLCSMVMLLALVCDLLVLPAMMMLPKNATCGN